MFFVGAQHDSTTIPERLEASCQTAVGDFVGKERERDQFPADAACIAMICSSSSEILRSAACS